MEIKLGHVQAMPLAFGFFTNEKDAQATVSQFAAANHKAEVETYFATIVITQRGIRNITYVQYVVAGAADVLPSGFRRVNLPEGPAAEITVSKEEYEAFLDGTSKDALDAFLKERQLKVDMRNVLFLAQAKQGVIEIKLPLKQ